MGVFLNKIHKYKVLRTKTSDFLKFLKRSHKNNVLNLKSEQPVIIKCFILEDTLEI